MKLFKSAALVLSATLSVAAWSQGAFPNRPITIVIPYPAGGASDSQVRMIAEPLGKALGTSIVVDNKPGASGSVAALAVARAKPDGYTLVYPNNGVIIAALLSKQPSYHPLKDFTPVATVTSVPMVLVVNKDVPVSNLDDFLRYAKAKPEGVLYASAGAASYGHLATTRLTQIAGFKGEHVPYKGEANTTMAVRAGEVQMLLTTPSTAMLGQVSQGNIRMLGVASEKPSPVVPGVRMVNQSVPGFNAEVWFGLLAPAGTPEDVVAKIHGAVQKVLADDAIRERFLSTGAMPNPSSSADFAALMKKEYAEWGEIITKYKIQAD